MISGRSTLFTAVALSCAALANADCLVDPTHGVVTADEITDALDGATDFPDDAFNGCTSLITITLPAGLTSLGSFTFLGCTSLATVTLPNGITRMGGGTFEGCTSLTTVTLPVGLHHTDGCTFCHCTSLTTVIFPASLTSFGGRAFWNCNSLTTVCGATGLTEIKNMFPIAGRTSIEKNDLAADMTTACPADMTTADWTIANTVELVHAGQECSAQSAHLGNIHSPEECAVAAAATSNTACNGLFMWSPIYNDAWGCRCCADDGGKRLQPNLFDEAGGQKTKTALSWNVYSYRDVVDEENDACSAKCCLGKWTPVWAKTNKKSCKSDEQLWLGSKTLDECKALAMSNGDCTSSKTVIHENGKNKNCYCLNTTSCTKTHSDWLNIHEPNFSDVNCMPDALGRILVLHDTTSGHSKNRCYEDEHHINGCRCQCADDPADFTKDNRFHTP